MNDVRLKKIEEFVGMRTTEELIEVLEKSTEELKRRLPQFDTACKTILKIQETMKEAINVSN